MSFGADGARADVVPNKDKNDRNDEDQCGDGVDFRGDAAAEARPDFEGKGIVAADEEEGNGDFVHGKREDEQAGGDEREFQIGESDAPEGLKGSGAKIKRSFFQSAVHFLESRKEFGSGHGNERRAMAEKNSKKAELESSEDSEH